MKAARVTSIYKAGQKPNAKTKHQYLILPAFWQNFRENNKQPNIKSPRN